MKVACRKCGKVLCVDDMYEHKAERTLGHRPYYYYLCDDCDKEAEATGWKPGMA